MYSVLEITVYVSVNVGRRLVEAQRIMPEAQQQLTVTEVAAILKIDKQTVYQMVWRGDLPAKRIGKKAIRIGDRDLAQFIATSENPSS